MTPRYSLALLSLATAGTLAMASCQSSSDKPNGEASTADVGFDRYKQRFVDSLWYYNPGWASSVGYHKYDSLLVIPNAGRRQQEAQAYNRWQKELREFEFGKLSVNNQTDYQLMMNLLQSSRWYADTLRNWEWNPAQYNLSEPVAEILNGRYQPLDRRLRSVSLKISRAAEFYEAAKSNLKNPTKEHLELAILQNRGGLEVFGKALQDSINRSGLSEQEKTQLRTRVNTTRMAIESYVSFLNKDVRPQATRSFRIGKPLFDRKFYYDIQSSSTADQVYQKAQAHKKELLRDMGVRATRLWPKYFAGKPMPADTLTRIREVIGKLSSVHTTQQGFVDAVKQQIPQLVKFVDEHKLLTQDPSKPLVVRETPLYMRGSGAGASVSAPGPYDKGADTYYNVEPIVDWKPEQAESYLREYNQYTLQILNIHEAIPGHYTQLVYANQSPSIIKAVLGNGAMIEGWAVYSERMMLESGYGNNSDEIWLMWDKWNMRVTLNTILDHLVHVGNISEQDAVQMLVRDGFQEQAEATNKWRRATLSQVQLSSYFTGYTEIYDLREELKQKQGKDFDLKAFNEQFLSYGSAPVKYIREMMLKK
ncbi:DUF885 domain-containing protein [Solirubrum puertoriconensis]|uniref:DUF885 domain-containing protein n=1 Tax=Solirubrum puertoriconensis TaxID=1751427 RepID=A0A9X0HKP7_SOLP1|nr:DUF885 domain-containing protein [Solirubrum puertoriconensis]KUG07536.1 hypothetical protein ASU33_14455 [Solirubrum puertoriconensis]